MSQPMTVEEFDAALGKLADEFLAGMKVLTDAQKAGLDALEAAGTDHLPLHLVEAALAEYTRKVASFK